MRISVAPKASGFHRAGFLDRNPSAWRSYFMDVMLSDDRLSGEVLDAGCGTVGPSNADVQRVYERASVVDGYDPRPMDEGLDPDRWYRQRWIGLPEDLELPREAYDAVVSINVLEHVEDGASYMKSCLDALRPGGVMYAYGPHGRHPFAACVRMVERFGNKRKMLDSVDAGGNDYPAVYRLSTKSGVLSSIEGLPVESVEFRYHPATQWRCTSPVRCAGRRGSTTGRSACTRVRSRSSSCSRSKNRASRRSVRARSRLQTPSR